MIKEDYGEAVAKPLLEVGLSNRWRRSPKYKDAAEAQTFGGLLAWGWDDEILDEVDDIVRQLTTA